MPPPTTSPEPPRRAPARWVALVLVGLAASVSNAGAQPATDCLGEAVEEQAVAAVIDGRTIRLEDGRTVRLFGVVVPGQGDAAKAHLQALVGDEPAGLRAVGAADRYGRTPAYLFTSGDDGPVLAQAALLERGLAVRSGDPEDTCGPEMRAAEQHARDGKLGLWADPYYLVKNAGDNRALLAERGRFAIAQGTVESVRESGGMIYLNFGRRWTEALSVGVQKRNEQAFARAGLPLKSLEGRSVRIRGYVDVRAGPLIEAARPEQIEVVTQP